MEFQEWMLNAPPPVRLPDPKTCKHGDFFNTPAGRHCGRCAANFEHEPAVHAWYAEQGLI